MINDDIISFEEIQTSKTEPFLQNGFILSNQDSFRKKFSDCVSLLLDLAGKERVVEALKIIAYDRVYDLKGLSQKFDRYIENIENRVNLKSLVNEQFLEKIKLHMSTKDDIDDYELCRSYFSRTISNNYDLFIELCKDPKIGDSVKKAAEIIVKQRREVITFSDEQLTMLFGFLINDVQNSSSPDIGEISQSYNVEYLNLYKKQFSQLKRKISVGNSSPLKPILLLAVISLFDKGLLRSNVIDLSNELISEFNCIWKQRVDKSLPFNCNIAMPFGHMKTEPFWHVSYKDTQNPDNLFLKYSVRSLREIITVRIDEELCELLQNSYCRKELSDVLLSMI